jgi:nitrogen fixation/metabolism regulation signal transduction histidine kinase
MKVRRKFIGYAILIHLVLIILSILLFSYSKYLFLAAEFLILISLGMTFHLYRAFLKPMHLLSAGAESMRDKDFSTTFVKTGQHELDQLIEVYNSMILQLRNERIRQREQHYFLERLIEAAPNGIVILDLDENVTGINPAAREVLGLNSEEVVGRALEELTSALGKELADMKAGETRIMKVNGIQTYRCHKSRFLDHGFHRHFILIEELTREIMSTQKRAYEKVIRMMSHEINNSVGAVNSILDSSLDYGRQLTSDDRQDFEEAIRVAIERNRGLNKFMSNFADVVRIPPPSKTEYDIHKLLNSIHLLMSSECNKRNIECVWDLCPSPMIEEIDVQQMEQALVNVIKNAIEAVDRDGTITIRTADNPKSLKIIDTGKGLTPEQQPQLFTPFYSTKRDGQGIGLTLIREILVNHGFRFNLETVEPGRTEFWIDFTQNQN